MRINNWSELYSLGYLVVSFGQRAFYKRYEIQGKENIPYGKPILLAANHQSAFMDPVVIAVQLKKPVYYMVRADIFRKPLVVKLLSAINMMPIFRQRDGGDTVKKNEAVFQRCYELLSKERPILIFPEGNHDYRKRLRPLKKGVFRIGIGAEEKYGEDLDIHIVPVGVNYSDNRNMGATMLINFGKPIRLNDYWGQYQKESAHTMNRMTAELRSRMSAELVDIQNLDYYEVIEGLLDQFDQEIYAFEEIKGKRLSDQFVGKKRFIERIEKYIDEHPEEVTELKSELERFTELTVQNKLKSWLFRKSKQSVFFHGVFHLLGLPFHLYGMINNYLPYKIPVWFVNNKVKDTQFHSSLKMGMGTILIFLFWVIQTILVAAFTDNYIWIVYCVSLPLFGKFSYEYWVLWLKFQGKLRYNKMKREKAASMSEMDELWVKINTRLKNMYKN